MVRQGGGGFCVTRAFVSGCCGTKTDTDGLTQTGRVPTGALMSGCLSVWLSVYGTSIPPSLLPIHPYIILQRHNISANPIAATAPRLSRPNQTLPAVPQVSPVTNPLPRFPGQVNSPSHLLAAIFPRATTRTQKNRNHPQQQVGWVCPSRHFGIVV